ncbi:hypothetical protein [Oricola thermophila]|uniref:Type II toxin-antitoxin system HicA family toxin n=1 Tax=Oricola thermophila TaxID=2742145 RepID=A0A6N1VGA9_9HYPH|nr:hypothetical protein [Oricola thermophila]QKV18685.1 hypothetical protein HTY61_09605 [Oricola thermophila]
MPRSRHPKKEVEAVLRELEALGWTVVRRHGKGHAWGLLRCPKPTEECRCGQYCQMTVFSTPQNAANHAAKLRSKAMACINPLREDEDNG